MAVVDLRSDRVALLSASGRPAFVAARELIVLEIYREGRMSGGRAAEFLGLSRWAFLQKASDAGIPYFNLTDTEWDQELRQGQTR